MIDRNKIKKYIVIFAISFLSFISFTFADEDYTNVLAGMGFGETRSIPSKGRSNFTCKGEGDLKLFSLKKKYERQRNFSKGIFPKPSRQCRDL